MDGVHEGSDNRIKGDGHRILVSLGFPVSATMVDDLGQRGRKDSHGSMRTYRSWTSFGLFRRRFRG